MPDNWKEYKEWKELMESIRKKPQVDNSYCRDDSVDDIKALYEEYKD